LGKLGKKAVERIRAMLAEGYSLTETAAELGHTRKTVASYADDPEASPVQGASGKMVLSLSDGDVKVLYNLQGILGASSVSDAIEMAFRDELAAMKFKLTIWDPRKFIYRTEVKPFTFENLVTVLTEDIKSLYEDIDEFIVGYDEDQRIIAELKKAAKEKVYVIR